MLNDAAVVHPHLVDAPDADGLPGGLDAQEAAEMGARTVQPERDQVIFLDNRGNFDMRVRESRTDILQHYSDESVRPVYITQCAMRDETVIKDGLHSSFVTLVDSGDQGRRDCLIRHMASLVQSGRGAWPPVQAIVPYMAADVLESLRTSRAWINYNPGPPFDFLGGAHPATPEQLRLELGRLHAAGFRGLVTNTMAFGLDQAPRIAKECGFEHVVAKIWWQDDQLLAEESANLDAALDAVDAVCLGNEVIQKGIADHGRLVREIDQARDRFGLPVTTGFQPPDWQSFPDLATAVGDFSFLNVHPWWVLHRNDPLTAAGWVVEAYGLVAGTPGMPPHRPVIVQETSFPSGAVSPEAAPVPRLRTSGAFTRRW